MHTTPTPCPIQPWLERTCHHWIRTWQGVNFFKGLAKAKDKQFRRWVQSRRDEWHARRYVIDADCANFMEEAENYYKDKVKLREWMQLDEDEEQIVALQARHWCTHHKHEGPSDLGRAP